MSFKFITPSEIIAHIRTNVPSFSSRVAGASSFDKIEDETKMAVPSCFVMLGNNSAETLTTQTGVQQRCPHTFDILLYLDSSDRRKQEAEDVSVAFKQVLISLLSGWKPTGHDNSEPLVFLGDQLNPSTPDRYARLYQFSQRVDYDSSEDGMGELGDYDSLDDFDTMIGSIINDIDGTEQTVGVQMRDIHE